MLDKETKKLLLQQNKIEELKKREERYSYLGLYETYKRYATADFSYKKLNSAQHRLFKEVLHGRGAYKNNFHKLPVNKQFHIRKLWQHGQKVINNFKNQVSNVYGNIIFSKFAELQFVCDIPINKTNDKIVNINSLKELGITYDDLILVFIKSKLLPKNFFSLC